MIDAVKAFDTGALLFIQENLRSEAFDYIMRFFSIIGDVGVCWIIFGIILLISKKTRRAGIDMLLCLAVATLVNNLALKPLVARPRPWTVIDELKILVAPLSSYSFPSAHSCSSFAAATSLFLAFRGKGGVFAFLPAALIALSRAYVGVHYPTDVLAGVIVGALCALATYKASHAISKGRAMSL